MTNFELNDKEMDLVNGGYDSPTIEEDGKGIKTLMRCEDCGWQINWAGNYMNNHYYDCPQCFAPQFHGIKLC